MSRKRRNLTEMDYIEKEKREKEERFPDYFYVSSFDLLRSPDLILKKIQLKIEQSKIVCLDCSTYVTFKFTDDYWSFKCKCGITIFYPPRKNRNYAYAKKVISADDYKKRDTQKFL